MIPPAVTAEQLAGIAAEVGERTGWDFSKVRSRTDAEPWSYDDVVASVIHDRARLLDVGTGGGEVLAGLLGRLDAGHTTAVDHNVERMTVARGNLRDLDVGLALADGRALPFRSDAFDIVLNRHAQVFPGEIARVLAPGGSFVLQQVGGRNAQSLFDAFGWGSNWDQWSDDDPPPRDRHALAHELGREGLEVVRSDEHEIGYAFADLPSLVFFLKAAPFPEPFDPVRHVDGINHLLQHCRSDRGIETTQHRELLVARRPP